MQRSDTHFRRGDQSEIGANMDQDANDHKNEKHQRTSRKSNRTVSRRAQKTHLIDDDCEHAHQGYT